MARAKTADPADVDIEAEEGAAEPKKPSRRMLLIAGAGALALVGGGGAGAAWYFGLLGGAEEAPVATPAELVFFDLPEMTVNLSTGSGRAQYLRLRATLELKDRADLRLLEPALPRILDAFQLFLRQLRPIDLEGSAGVHRLKEELIRRINAAIYPARVENVLFRELIVQ